MLLICGRLAFVQVPQRRGGCWRSGKSSAQALRWGGAGRPHGPCTAGLLEDNDTVTTSTTPGSLKRHPAAAAAAAELNRGAAGLHALGSLPALPWRLQPSTG
jgi:hypothetical protein